MEEVDCITTILGFLPFSPRGREAGDSAVAQQKAEDELFEQLRSYVSPALFDMMFTIAGGTTGTVHFMVLEEVALIFKAQVGLVP